MLTRELFQHLHPFHEWGLLHTWGNAISGLQAEPAAPKPRLQAFPEAPQKESLCPSLQLQGGWKVFTSMAPFRKEGGGGFPATLLFEMSDLGFSLQPGGQFIHWLWSQKTPSSGCQILPFASLVGSSLLFRKKKNKIRKKIWGAGRGRGDIQIKRNSFKNLVLNSASQLVTDPETHLTPQIKDPCKWGFAGRQQIQYLNKAVQVILSILSWTTVG